MNKNHLRIKKDVDLKELEKFGYEYNKLCNCWEKSLIPMGYLLFVAIYENRIIDIISNFGDDDWLAETGDIRIADIEKAGLTETY